MSEPERTYWSGGCQCGAVRFRADCLGRASHCHCRMCQKAFGSIGGSLVVAIDLVWTRSAPKYFQSSNKVRRGFCGTCGTPLTFEFAQTVDVAIATFDKSELIAPDMQLVRAARLPWADGLATLPERSGENQAMAASFSASIISYQHPDHDTAEWPSPGLKT